MKTHCRKGHELTPDNIKLDWEGYTACKTCYLVRRREYDKKRWHDGYTPATHKSDNCSRCNCEFTVENGRACGDRAECKKCFNSRVRKYRNKHKEHIAILTDKSRLARLAENKKLIYNAYGNKCACCGFDDIPFLTIQHVNGGGGKHRKERNTAGVYLDVIRTNFSSDYCLFCVNCNWADQVYGECPHETRRKLQSQAAD